MVDQMMKAQQSSAPAPQPQAGGWTQPQPLTRPPLPASMSPVPAPVAASYPGLAACDTRRFTPPCGSQAYLLSTLIAFLSGVWPYIKLSLMALCWAAPATHLSPLWRERLLRAVDALGKWSYLDTMMLVVFTVAFHIPFDLPSTSPAAPRLVAAL